MGDKLLTPQEVADHLGVPLRTIYNWRTAQVGPRAIRVGKHLRYRPAEVERWLDSQTGDQDVFEAQRGRRSSGAGQ